MADETITQMQNRLNDEHIFKVLEVHEKRLEIANSEMGAVKTSMEVIESDIRWIKDILVKTETRTWLILSAIILTTLLNIAFQFFK